MAGTTRRRLLLGGTALGLSATAAGSPAPYPLRAHDAHLIALGAQLDRQMRGVRRLSAKVRPRGDPVAWSQWSAAVSACAELCDVIAKSPPQGTIGVLIHYKALLWQLLEDDLILDRTIRRRAIAFGCELQMLAKQSHTGSDT
jgi:hypothetical protein